MASNLATITFSLPEDIDSDRLHLLRAPTRDGTYVLERDEPYTYGETKLEATLDDQSWYRVRFHNSQASTSGPRSQPVYGGDFSQASPFLAVSSTTDGANYASVQDVYDYSGLSTQDISQDRVSIALRRARASIDLRTAEMGLDRFWVFNTPVARRKYNASLRVLKEAEINVALGNLYQNLTDDIIIESRRSKEAAGGLSIGGTAVGADSIGSRSENIAFLAALADRYFATGESLLSQLDANSVRLTPGDYFARTPRFTMPFRGWVRSSGGWNWY